jgi:SNF2 family DNA or RNA helicase
MELYKHQALSVEKLLKHNVGAILSDTGTGKTLSALELIKRKNCYLNLIICPKISLNVWKREIESYLPGSLIFVLDKGAEKNREILRDAWKSQAMIQLGVRIFVIQNYESAWRDKTEPLKYFHWNMLIADEAHALCNNSKQTKFLLAARKRDKKWNIDNKLILSATLASNDLTSIFRPFQFLSSEILDGNYYQLRERYFQKLRDFLWIEKQGARDEIMKKITPYTVRFKKEDCLDLPPITYKQIDIELSPKESKAYKEIKEELIIEIGDQTIVIPSKLVALGKLMQVSSGFLYTEEKEVINIGNTKINALKTLLEGVSNQTIIFTAFKESARRIADLDGVIEYIGKVDALDAFVAGEYKNIVMNIASARSINLQNAGVIIYYERNFSLTARLQSEGRISRIGQKNDKLTIFDIFSSPIERYVYKKVVNKKKINDSIPVSELVNNI